MCFGRNTSEERCFLVSASYEEVLEVSSNVCDVNFDHLVKEISARFLPWKVTIFKL